jgi:hypothetical protein
MVLWERPGKFDGLVLADFWYLRIVLLIWGSFIPSIFYGFGGDMEMVRVYWAMVSFFSPNLFWTFYQRVGICSTRSWQTDSRSLADHKHRGSDRHCRAVPAIPHASLEAFPRFYVRRYGPERCCACLPRHSGLRRRTAEQADGSVLARHARLSVHSWSRDLRCK